MLIGGRYKQIEEIRRGAFGSIHRGIYEKTGEQVAIKMDIDQASLQHEIKMINYLYISGVRNIPSIYWFGKFDENPCVVMTLYECSLYDYRLNGQPTEEKIGKIMWKVLDILENIHKKFVVHRDIKPQNFMIKGGEIYLIDFGLATFYMGENGHHLPDTQSNHIIGSPLFVSVRIHEGHRYSRRDDLISMAYVYLWMLGKYTLRPPLPKDTPEISPLDIAHPTNTWLLHQKSNIFSFMTNLEHPGIGHYIEYVYAMLYDEAPKYQEMKMAFNYDTTASAPVI